MFFTVTKIECDIKELNIERKTNLFLISIFFIKIFCCIKKSKKYEINKPIIFYNSLSILLSNFIDTDSNYSVNKKNTTRKIIV
jgi:hypothetical protein